MGARAGKCKSRARAEKYKSRARTGKYKLGVRAVKCQLGKGPGAGKNKYPYLNPLLNKQHDQLLFC